jgi:sec-independent protein translocase protein TatA
MGLENPLHLMIVLVVVLVVFGAKRLPDMGRSMGEGMRGFKEAISGETAPSTHHLATVVNPQPAAAEQPIVVQQPVVVQQPIVVEPHVTDAEHAHVV